MLSIGTKIDDLGRLAISVATSSGTSQIRLSVLLHGDMIPMKFDAK